MTTNTRLLLTSRQLSQIVAQAERTYPEECCGILVGSSTAATAPGGPARFRVVQLIEADNQREEASRHNRYVIDPLELLRAQKSARAQDLEVLGYYHSHPDHPSAPSDFDRDHAWPNTSYLIVSVREGKARDHRSWRLLDDRSAFAEEPVQIEDSPLPG